MNKSLIYSFLCIIAINDGKIKAGQIDGATINEKQQVELLKNALTQNKLNDAHDALKKLTARLKFKAYSTLNDKSAGLYTYLKTPPEQQKLIKDSTEKILHEMYEFIESVKAVMDPALEVAKSHATLLATMMNTYKDGPEMALKETLSKQLPASNPVVTVFDTLQFNTLTKLYYEEFVTVANQFVRDVMRATIDFVTFGGHKA